MTAIILCGPLLLEGGEWEHVEYLIVRGEMGKSRYCDH